MNNYSKTRERLFRAGLVLAGVASAAAFSVWATTTISTNLSTGGNLTVSGNSTLTGTVAVGGGTAITKILFSGTCTVNPPALSAMGNAVDKGHAACTDATGVSTSDIVLLSSSRPAGWINDVVITSASSTAADTINFVFKNTSTTTANNIGAVSIPWFSIQ